MKIDIPFSLPFPWCGDCEGFDPESVDFYDGVLLIEINRRCRNEITCERHEAARKRALAKAKQTHEETNKAGGNK